MGSEPVVLLAVTSAGCGQGTSTDGLYLRAPFMVATPALGTPGGFPR